MKRYYKKTLINLGLLILLSEGIGLSEQAAKRNLKKLEVPVEMKSCKFDVDCVETETSCGRCCQEEAINKNFTTTYYKHRESFCKGYSGIVCNCIVIPHQIRCRDSRCELVPMNPKKR